MGVDVVNVRPINGSIYRRSMYRRSIYWWSMYRRSIYRRSMYRWSTYWGRLAKIYRKIGFWEKRPFFAENWQKSQKIVILTRTLGPNKTANFLVLKFSLKFFCRFWCRYFCIFSKLAALWKESDRCGLLFYAGSGTPRSDVICTCVRMYLEFTGRASHFK
jgi:hypothetical protein